VAPSRRLRAATHASRRSAKCCGGCHWTPMLDFKILLLTAIKLFRDDQAY
jgi:hypothetical protein